MKFRQILNLAATATAMINPVVGSAILALNKVLDPGDQIPMSSTVADIEAGYNKLPPDQQISLRESQIELDITESNNWAQVQMHLADADANGASTRPAIANRMAWLVVSVIGLLVAALLYAVGMGDTAMVNAITDTMPLIGTLMVAPTGIVMQYTGARTREKNNRYAAATGQDVQVGGILSTLLGGK